MLALVALVEAGQRSRYDDPSENPLGYGKSSLYEYPQQQQQQEENFDWYSPWADSAEYYGLPYENLEAIPRYESALKENHQGIVNKLAININKYLGYFNGLKFKALYQLF